jgi:murein DD-endopeptidase MepM/ murein hydrolase activator NlpD
VQTVPALVAISLLLGALFTAPPAHAATWRWPLRGPIQRAFGYTTTAPFARGQHRGITIAATAASPVSAACAGRVSFAGAVPGGRGAGVTVICGALTATYLRLDSVAVRRGDRVGVGDRLGRLGRRGLHLGARQTGRRWGYVDPVSLFDGDPGSRPVPLGPAPRRRLGPPRIGPGPRPRAAPRPVPFRWSAPAPAAAPAAATARPAVPVVAWVGLVLLAAALPALGIGRARRRRRRGEPGSRRRYAPADAA